MTFEDYKLFEDIVDSINHEESEESASETVGKSSSGGGLTVEQLLTMYPYVIQIYVSWHYDTIKNGVSVHFGKRDITSRNFADFFSNALERIFEYSRFVDEYSVGIPYVKKKYTEIIDGEYLEIKDSTFDANKYLTGSGHHKGCPMPQRDEFLFNIGVEFSDSIDVENFINILEKIYDFSSKNETYSPVWRLCIYSLNNELSTTDFSLTYVSKLNIDEKDNWRNFMKFKSFLNVYSYIVKDKYAAFLEVNDMFAKQSECYGKEMMNTTFHYAAQKFHQRTHLREVNISVPAAVKKAVMNVTFDRELLERYEDVHIDMYSITESGLEHHSTYRDDKGTQQMEDILSFLSSHPRRAMNVNFRMSDIGAQQQAAGVVIYAGMIVYENQLFSLFLSVINDTTTHNHTFDFIHNVEKLCGDTFKQEHEYKIANAIYKI